MDDHIPFVSSLSKEPTTYIHDAQHRWLSILVKVQTPVTVEQLKTAGVRACFALVDKEDDVSPWRRIILRKIRNTMWEVLDEFGESVLDTVHQAGEEGIIDLWGVRYNHPIMRDYEEAVRSDQKRKMAAEARAEMVRESPARKRLRDDAYESLMSQGRTMKKSTQSKMVSNFEVGSIVQVPLHDVDTTKADGKNLTLVVVEVVQKKDNSCAMYRLACKAGVLATLYHPSYLTSVAANSDILGLNSVPDEWTGLPVIKERAAAASMSMVGGQGKHLGCGCKSGTCRTVRCSCFKAGIKCNSKCHGGVNKKCINKDE